MFFITVSHHQWSLDPQHYALISLLNSIVGGLGGPSPIGIDLINYRVRFPLVMCQNNLSLSSWLMPYMPSFWQYSWWLYDDDMACLIISFLQNSFNYFWNETGSCIWYHLLGNSNSAKTILKHVNKLLALNLFCLLDYRKCTVIIYNTKEITLINCR